MPNLNAYHRPANVDEALQLLSRPAVNTAIVSGGTYVTAHMPELVEEVVDLQVAGLDEVTYTSQSVTLGAMVRLQTMIDDGRVPALLREAARREGPRTLRNAATVGGALTCSSRESELLAAMLVYDAHVEIQSTNHTKNISLINFLRDIPSALNGGLVISVSLDTIGQTASARAARTPADRAIVAALARLDDDGKVRLALCGVGNTPVLIDPDNIKAAINPPNDFRGSREYRRQMAATLADRVMRELLGA